MAIQTQIYYVATSKVKEIRNGAAITYQWGEYGAWTNFKNPVAVSNKKVKYNASTKNKPNTTKGIYGGVGGVTVLGTAIPATATRTISGEQRTCAVRYYKRGYVKYTRTRALKNDGKMRKITYNNTHPLQYRLQYQDKPVLDASYSTYSDGKEFIFFADKYYDNGEHPTPGHIPHPTTCTLSFSDCRRNFESSTNNSSDGRDNKGSYRLSNVRANIVTFELEWTGLSNSEGIDLINTLNPGKDKTGQYPYLIVQYLNPQTGKVRNGTFYAEERVINKYPNGMFQSIAVTLTEV